MKGQGRNIGSGHYMYGENLYEIILNEDVV